MARTIDIINKLRRALEAAQTHLEFCGYGDSYERECAYNERLPETIQAALDETKDFLEETPYAPD